MRQIKYPKTPYLSISPSIDSEDPTIDPSIFIGNPISVSIKMDGSCTAMNQKEVYGRSTHHTSFNQIKQLHGQIKHLIPMNDHVFGESLVAKHSIHYKDDIALADIYQIFAIYHEDTNLFSDFDYAMELSKELGVPHVINMDYNIDNLESLQRTLEHIFKKVIDLGHEGIVIRNKRQFPYDEFGVNVAKMVRPHHVQSKIHWTKQEIVYNQCRTKMN